MRGGLLSPSGCNNSSLFQPTAWRCGAKTSRRLFWQPFQHAWALQFQFRLGRTRLIQFIAPSRVMPEVGGGGFFSSRVPIIFHLLLREQVCSRGISGKCYSCLPQAHRVTRPPPQIGTFAFSWGIPGAVPMYFIKSLSASVAWVQRQPCPWEREPAFP